MSKTNGVDCSNVCIDRDRVAISEEDGICKTVSIGNEDDAKSFEKFKYGSVRLIGGSESHQYIYDFFTTDHVFVHRHKIHVSLADIKNQYPDTYVDHVIPFYDYEHDISHTYVDFDKVKRCYIEYEAVNRTTIPVTKFNLVVNLQLGDMNEAIKDLQRKYASMKDLLRDR